MPSSPSERLLGGYRLIQCQPAATGLAPQLPASRRGAVFGVQSQFRTGWQTWAVSESSVYAPSDVEAVRALWQRSGGAAGPEIATQLDAFAHALVAARDAGDRSAAVLISNWARDRLDELASTTSLVQRDARLIVARDHGFSSWFAVEGRCDPLFEQAVDAVVFGRLKELSRLLTAAPDLVTRRSAYGHRATLLHYTAANGVEIRRQIVPRNAGEIATALLDAGADAAATFRAYGGTPDTLAMLRSSAHPRAAGVAERLERVLTDANHGGCSDM